MWRLAAVMGILAMVAACGGGGGKKPAGPVPNPKITTLTGFVKPVETASTQGARAGGIIGNADRLFLFGSRIHGSREPVPEEPAPLDPFGGLPPVPRDPPEDPPGPVQFAYPLTGCGAGAEASTGCETRFTRGQDDQNSPESKAGPAGGVTSRYGPGDVNWITPSSQSVFAADGVTVVNAVSTHIPSEHAPALRSWGAWMQHAGFVLHTAETVLPDTNDMDAEYRTAWRYSLAAGDVSGTRPFGAGTLTWKGVMTGMTTDGATLLAGKTTVAYATASQTLDITIDGIRNAETDGAWNKPILFENVRVNANGTFSDGRQDVGTQRVAGYVDGAFFGPGHEEAAGVFEQNNVVGAFGAKRVEQ